MADISSRTQQILEHISRCPQGCRFPELVNVYFGYALAYHHVSTTSLASVRTRLNRLVMDDKLRAVGEGATCRWYAIAHTPDTNVRQIVPPRRINVMQGTYVPTPSPTLRSGAADYRTCPSRGLHC
jgi:hypothetical protein